MHFQVEIPENGRKNALREKPNNKEGTVDVFG